MRDLHSMFMWSFKLCRIAGIEVRIHWSLLLIMILKAPDALQRLPWWMLPAILLIPFISVLLHEFGHSLMARLVGGDSRKIVMWMFGGLALCEIPHSWGRHFIVAAAGPMVTFVLMAVAGIPCGFSIAGMTDWGFNYPGPLFTGSTVEFYFWVLLAYTANINAYLLLFNLMPAYPLDGGAMLRALLWPIVGLQRAVPGTCIVAFVILPTILVATLLTGEGSFFLWLLLIMLFLTVMQEYQMAKRGQFLHNIDPARDHSASWWEQRQKRVTAQRRQRETELESQRNQRLDELLAKVSEHGLPSLTDAERKFLQEYSQRERDRS